MKVGLLPPALVWVLATCGCASRPDKYTDDPALVAGTFEYGEVVQVELVEPDRCRVWSTYAYAGYGYPAYRGDASGYFTITPGRSCKEPDRVIAGERADAVAARAAQDLVVLEKGQTIQTTVRRTQDDQIRVVSQKDIGLVPGERVRLGLREQSARRDGNRVVLSRPSDELLSDEALKTLDRPPVVDRYPYFLSIRMTSFDLDRLTRVDRHAWALSAAFVLYALEADYVDYLYGYRNEDALLQTIPALTAPTQMYFVNLAWKDVRRRVVPEFASRVEENLLAD